MESYPPETADRIAMLTGRRDELRQQGFAAIIDLEVLEAQPGPLDEPISVQGSNGHPVRVKRGEYMGMLRERASNAYKAARRLDNMIGELKRATPEPEPS